MGKVVPQAGGGPAPACPSSARLRQGDGPGTYRAAASHAKRNGSGAIWQDMMQPLRQVPQGCVGIFNQPLLWIVSAHSLVAGALGHRW